ncbi:unnamed protein product [Periconia digitata]|uniref:Apple domain-containing protein n=1 Tax=Periconia digitata TaxID=1303443 RepID=A0A9W4U8A5_9PLEO|nr:unnamed protein product [Periconia digitata]
MRVTSLRAATALLPAICLAQATTTHTSPTATTSATPSCTASPITKLCDYPEPGPEFAVASESRASCWSYCNAHQPCSFSIFVAGNPNTGTGTCWLYPGKDFDEKAGSTNCGNPSLFVDSKPACAGGTPTSGACTATSSPSALASVCGYPAPGDCFEGCLASDGASSCLSYCAKAEACSYAVFNPGNPSNSPFASGNCWIYPNGTFDAQSASLCSGQPEQFVYNNACPKPPSSSSPSPSSSQTSPSPSPSSTGPNGTGAASAAENQSSGNEGPASGEFPLYSCLITNIALLVWQRRQ